MGSAGRAVGRREWEEEIFRGKKAPRAHLLLEVVRTCPVCYTGGMSQTEESLSFCSSIVNSLLINSPSIIPSWASMRVVCGDS